MEMRYRCKRCGREGEGDSQTFEECAEEDILPMTPETQGQDALEALKDVAEHAKDCVRNGFRSGRATANGGYECYYQTVDGAKWFQAKPIDETPKCDCGLDAALATLTTALSQPRFTEEEIREIVKYVYEYKENADCSCSYDPDATCWYHMSDEERINMLTRYAPRPAMLDTREGKGGTG